MSAPTQDENVGSAISNGRSPAATAGKGIIVGIGASAGGLDAFKKFFRALPAQTGLAYVLIPHLDPDHKSLMAELVSRCTTMPVVEASEGMTVAVDHVYILPPNKYMTLAEGALRLKGPIKRQGLQTSIDVFLRSLGEEMRERAVGIILSGTGAHGTLGLKVIKENGGAALVQDPATAQFAGMPESAISAGLADLVLPPEQMPEALLQYVKRYFNEDTIEAPPTEDVLAQLNLILDYANQRLHHDFRCYRKKMLIRRIERRMGLINVATFAAYLAYLRENDAEVPLLVADLLISVTSFFRDADAFKVLETEIIPQIVKQIDGDLSLRVWVPACATGEEAYSLAILFLEQLALAHKNCRLQVFATDVDDEALETGRRGAYLDTIATGVSPERLTRFFAKVEPHHYRVSKALRDTVVFARHNLLHDAPFSKMDMVSCRNLFIYLEAEIQKRVLPLLHFALNEKGYLMLGSSETIGDEIGLFETVSRKWRIFRRTGATRIDRLELPIRSRQDGPRIGQSSVRSRANPPDLADIAKQILLRDFAPAAVLINRRLEILFFYGPTYRFLEQPTGEPTKDLMALAHSGIRGKLRAAVNQIVIEKLKSTAAVFQMRSKDGSVTARLTVRELDLPSATDGPLLVTFEEIAGPAETEAKPLDSEATESDLIHHLESDLKAIRDELQDSIEELEESNEQLKASNEEVMSVNEELQSTNEELQTSKEELQSLNEELSTVNVQLREKVEELENANNDIANLLGSTDIATLFLDRELRIKSFTPATTRLLNLIATDVGRPIADIVLKLDDPDMLRDAEEVLQQLTPRERERRRPAALAFCAASCPISPWTIELKGW